MVPLPKVDQTDWVSAFGVWCQSVNSGVYSVTLPEHSKFREPKLADHHSCVKKEEEQLQPKFRGQRRNYHDKIEISVTYWSKWA